MNPAATSTFVLPERLAPKADPAHIAADERHFARIADTLGHELADLADRLDAARPAATASARSSATSGSTG